jgi:hypothetical protein
MMRAQADDYRRALVRQAEVNQQLLREHAQASLKLLTQAGNQVEQLVRSEQQQTQESNRQVAYLIDKVQDAQQETRQSEASVRQSYYAPPPQFQASYYGARYADATTERTDPYHYDRD